MRGALAALAAAAAQSALAAPPVLWHAQVDNDVFHSDRWYTSGVRIYRSAPLDGASPGAAFLRLPGTGEQRLDMGLVHEIYTGDGRQDPALPDRPNAARLLFSLARHDISPDTLATLGVDAGVAGPSARGEEVQDLFHRIAPAPETDWSSQVGDRADVQAVAAWSHRLGIGALPGALVVHAGGVAGTLTTFGHAGIEWRSDAPAQAANALLRFAATPPAAAKRGRAHVLRRREPSRRRAQPPARPPRRRPEARSRRGTQREPGRRGARLVAAVGRGDAGPRAGLARVRGPAFAAPLRQPRHFPPPRLSPAMGTSFVHGIRFRLLVASLVLLAIPALAAQFIARMEAFLRGAQEQDIAVTARAVASALSDRPALFPPGGGVPGDPEDEERRRIVGLFAAADPVAAASLGTAYAPSEEIERFLEIMGRRASRLWVVDTRSRVRGLSGTLREPPPARADASRTAIASWLKPVVSLVVSSPEVPAGDESKPVRSQIDRALIGVSSTYWRGTKDREVAILSAAQPVFVGDDIVGAVVVEETTASILLLRQSALENLIALTLAVCLAAFAILLVFATRLATRIRRLHAEAESAIDAQGRIRGAITLTGAKDEIGDLERTIAAVLGRLRDYNAYLEQMASRLSHELRTPVAVVRSSLDNLRSQSPEGEARVYLDRAGGGRGAALAAHLAPVRRHAPGEDAGKRGARALRPRGGRARLRRGLPHRVPRPCLRLRRARRGRGDEGRRPTRSPSSSTSWWRTRSISRPPAVPSASRFPCDGRRARLGVANDGPPIPAALLPRLFDAMVSARDEGHGRGGHLGLGLAIVRLVAAFHGGGVRAVNLPEGRGVLFEVDVPVEATPPELNLGRTTVPESRPWPESSSCSSSASSSGCVFRGFFRSQVKDDAAAGAEGGRGHGGLRALRREHAPQRGEGGGRQVHLRRPLDLQARPMTPAALASGAVAERLRPGDRAPMAATGDDTAWRTLVIFSAYRVVLALGLSGAYAFLNSLFQFGVQQPGLAVTALVAYAVASVLLVVPALLREPGISLQVTAAVFVDVLAICVLMHTSGGIRSGIGVSLLISLAAAGLITRGRLAFFHAAVAALAVLVEHAFQMWRFDAPASDFLQSGLTSMALFATAGLGWTLARYARTSETIARQRTIDLANLSQINELVIRDMQDGLLVVDPEGTIRQSNPRAAAAHRAASAGAAPAARRVLAGDRAHAGVVAARPRKLPPPAARAALQRGAGRALRRHRLGRARRPRWSSSRTWGGCGPRPSR